MKTAVFNNIVKFQINRTTSALHPTIVSDPVPISEFASVDDAFKYTDHRAKFAKRNKWNVNITWQDNKGEWHFYKKY